MPRGLRKSLSGFFKNVKPASEEAPPPLPPLIEQTQRLSVIETPRKPPKPEPKPSKPVPLLTPELLRELRETIRLRYALDIEIWSQREAKFYARDKLKENMRRSEAALSRIKEKLEEWDRAEYFTNSEEHKKFQEIKRRLTEGEKADWTRKPPWEFVNHAGNPYREPWETDGQPLISTERLSNSNRPQMHQTSRPMGGPQRPHAGFTRPTNGSQSYANSSQRPIQGALSPDDVARRLARGPPPLRPGGTPPRHTQIAPSHEGPPYEAPTYDTPPSGASWHSTPQHATPRSFSSGQRPLFDDQTPVRAYQSPKYRVASPVDSAHATTPLSAHRVPPPPPPTEGMRSPSFQAPRPFDGDGAPVLSPPEPSIRSRRATMDAQRRVTGPPAQWQDEPVEFAKIRAELESSLRSRYNS